ncbi:hypothetical protein KAW38_04865 [Candidatus Micrarchaeota archaeon]|nr:hypothetical protein [Candidatus Micrarchaeota archaeon]
MEESPLYEKVNNVWKSTCRIIFGEEIGELKEYEKWLSEYREPFLKKKSAISGKDVYCSNTQYCGDAKFISLNEIDFNKKFEPLSINEVKDIDSIVEGLQERFHYCGNIKLGNSQFVERSSNVFNSNYVSSSTTIFDSNYISNSSRIRVSKTLFGCYFVGESNSNIRIYSGWRLSRSFESYEACEGNDVIYSANVVGCSECMFSIGLRGKKYVIGNRELEKDTYAKIKEKLIGEIKDELEKEKRIFSFIDIIKTAQADTISSSEEKKGIVDKETIEKAYRKTLSVVLQCKTSKNIDHYKNFLMKNVPEYIEKRKSTISNRGFFTVVESLHKKLPKEVFVEFNESQEMAKNRKLNNDDIKNLESIITNIKKIAFINFDYRDSRSENMIETPSYQNSKNAYHVAYAYGVKNSAFSQWPRNSEYMFGTSETLHSLFCINCYFSRDLARAFEVDSSRKCSDVYYSHNCENVHDSMFCFNKKNIRNGIGNAEYGKDEYLRIKSSLLEQIVNELEQKENLKWNIYNIGCG